MHDINLDDATAYDAFLQDLADNPPPLKTTTVRRKKKHSDRPCGSPSLRYVSAPDLKLWGGYFYCCDCGMFDGWVEEGEPVLL